MYVVRKHMISVLIWFAHTLNVIFNSMCFNFFIFLIPAKGYLLSTRDFFIIYRPPLPTYELHLKDPPEIEDETLGIIVADIPIIIFGLLRNMKSKLIV